MASSQDSTQQPFHWHYSGFEDKSFHFHGRALLLIIILFSLLILFTLLCLYARWVCRYRHHSAASPTTNEAAAAAPEGSAAGLDLATINSFPTLLHRSSSSDEQAQCSICLCSFRYEEKVKVLPDCNHAYHPECVDEWLSSRSSCPLCRASLRVDTPTPTPTPIP